jgi:hypothetical protein
VHGCYSSNLVYRICHEQNIALSSDEGGYSRAWSKPEAWKHLGENIVSDVTDALSILSNISGQLHTLAERMYDAGEPDISIGEAISRIWPKLTQRLSRKTKNQAAIEALESLKVLAWAYTADINKLSLYYHSTIFEELIAVAWPDELAKGYPERDADGMVEKGYAQFIQYLNSSIDSARVKLNSQVAQINWNDQGVALRTRDGSEVNGDYAIVTLPLGVLKSSGEGAVQFEPKLPERKLDAIKQLGMGSENKVLLCFESVFWPDAAYLECLDVRFRFLNLNHFQKGKALIVMCNPPFSEWSALSNEEVVEQVLSAVEKSFGTRGQLTFSHVTRWQDDIYARGESQTHAGFPC